MQKHLSHFIAFVLCLVNLSTSAVQEIQTGSASELLQQRWELTKLKIGEQAAAEASWYSSICLFRNNKCGIEPEEFLKVSGDVNEEISGYRVVHIPGDVNQDIYMGDHAELIIAGKVNKEVTIFAEGIVRIFVGGSFHGILDSVDSVKILIGEDFKGQVRTGFPSTHLFIGGNYEGSINSNKEDGSLLYLVVKGYAPETKIHELYEQNYTSIHSSFGKSDIAPGIHYPAFANRQFFTIVGR